MMEKTWLAEIVRAPIRSDHPIFSAATPGLDEKEGIKRIYLGGRVFGLAALAFGIVDVVWRQFNDWQQMNGLGHIPRPEILVCIAGAVQIFGGMAIQWPRTVRVGALTLGAIYLAFGLLWVPFIVAKPLTYGHWGSFFEQFSLVSGALIVYASFDRGKPERAAKLASIGYICFASCVVSFTLEQVFYLSGTAALVPKWIPPGQMFWAITTTVAFALGAVALLTGRFALLASRLLTAMIIGFGLLIWLPAPFEDPHKLINWAANAQNLAIAGAAWIVADFIGEGANLTPPRKSSAASKS
jgi:uncharacterized membrane protein YphA (DoxX/SURF4 family)